LKLISTFLSTRQEDSCLNAPCFEQAFAY